MEDFLSQAIGGLGAGGLTAAVLLLLWLRYGPNGKRARQAAMVSEGVAADSASVLTEGIGRIERTVTAIQHDVAELRIEAATFREWREGHKREDDMVHTRHEADLLNLRERTHKNADALQVLLLREKP